MTPAKRAGSLGSSSKLLSERVHSYPAIIATDAHNHLIVATKKKNSFGPLAEAFILFSYFQVYLITYVTFSCAKCDVIAFLLI